jgi:hypothetical protein
MNGMEYSEALLTSGVVVGGGAIVPKLCGYTRVRCVRQGSHLLASGSFEV